MEEDEEAEEGEEEEEEEATSQTLCAPKTREALFVFARLLQLGDVCTCN